MVACIDAGSPQIGLVKDIAALGGKVVQPKDMEKATHLVGGTSSNNWKRAQELRIHCVTAAWVDMCKEMDARVPERFQASSGPSADQVVLGGGVATMHAAPPAMVEMWRKGELTDAQVVVAGQPFDCHRLVLAANSGYFHVRFTATARHQVFADAAGPIYLDELDASVFAAMLEFFYEGRVRLPDWQLLQPLVLAASRLQAERLLDACVGAVGGLLNEQNCEGVLSLAEAITRPDLAAPAERMLAKLLSSLAAAGDSAHVMFITKQMYEHPHSSAIALAGCKQLAKLSSTPFFNCAHRALEPARANACTLHALSFGGCGAILVHPHPSCVLHRQSHPSKLCSGGYRDRHVGSAQLTGGGAWGGPGGRNRAHAHRQLGGWASPHRRGGWREGVSERHL